MGKRTSRRGVRALLLATMAAAGQHAAAGIYYDLRFADGSHNMLVTTPGAYTLDLWVRVSGADADSTNEGVQLSYIDIFSTQTAGGAMTSGGLSDGQVTTDFQSYSGSVPIYRNGGGADVNADGITDWGSKSTAIADTSYMMARASGHVMAGGTVGQQVNASLWEFKMASFTVNVNAVGNGTTAFNVVKPYATTGIAITYASGRVDGVNFNVLSTNTQGAYTNSIGVLFTTSSTSSSPKSIVWDGGSAGTGTEWTEAANWATDPISGTEHVPASFDDATFSAAGTPLTVGINMAGATNNGAANQAIAAINASGNRDLTIQNSSSTPGTLTLNVNAAGTLLSNGSSSNTLTLKNGPNAPMNIALGASGNVVVSNTGATTVISSAISGTNKGITKTGAGTLVLDGLNTYSGLTNISAGKAIITSAGGLASSAVSVNSFSTLDIAGSLNPSTNLTASGQVSFSSASQSLGSLTGSGTLSLAGTSLSVSSGNFSGSLFGSGSLIKQSAGTFTLANARSGNINLLIQGGAVEAPAPAITGNIVNAGSIVSSGSGQISANISGNGSFSKTGTGFVTFITASSYSGPTSIGGGTLSTSGAYLLAPLSTFSLTAPAQLRIGTDQRIGNLSGDGDAFLSGSISASPTLYVGGNNTSASFAGNVSGTGNLVKEGAGLLQIGSSLNSGSTTVNNGTLKILAQAAGSTYYAHAGGSVALAGTVMTNAVATLRADAGGTIDYVGARINGGFLRGPGTQTTSGATASTFTGTNALNGSVLTLNAPASLVNFSNSGRLNANTNVTWDGGTMGASGILNVNATANVDAVDSLGVINVASGGTFNNSQTNFVAGGGSRTTVLPGGAIQMLDGTSFDISGGLLVNNGSITGDINVYYGSTVKGAGAFNGSVSVFDGGKFSPGNSPGKALVGSFLFGAGGSYLFEVADATGVSGVGMDFLDITNALTISATNTSGSKFLISVASLDAANSPGVPSHFDPSQAYQWILAHAGGGIVGFAADKFAVDAGAFMPAVNSSRFTVATSGNDLVLNYAPVPEPAAGVVVLAGVLGWGGCRRRKPARANDESGNGYRFGEISRR